MKIFISVDMEGISGIVHWSDVGADLAEYERGGLSWWEMLTRPSKVF